MIDLVSCEAGCNRTAFKGQYTKRWDSIECVGAWRSPVAYSLGVRVVGRSNRLAPTKTDSAEQ